MKISNPQLQQSITAWVATGLGQSKDRYHTTPECPHFPGRNKTVSPREIRWHDMQECRYCQRVRKSYGDYEYTSRDLYHDGADTEPRQRPDSAEPWRYECPNHHISLRTWDRGGHDDIVYCLTCQDTFEYVFDKKTGEEVREF